ncbi:MAG: cyclase family protein [Anaerolineaceae bacterium]
MKIYDISVGLSASLPCWPNELGFNRDEKTENSVCVSEIHMSAHSGTHIDAPSHFISEGKRISDFPIERFLGKARVCSISDPRSITWKELKSLGLHNVEKLLFHTANSKLWKMGEFCPGYTGLELEAAMHLIGLGIRLLGTDYLSIEAYDSRASSVHKTLLSHDILILEGLNLADVPDGEYSLICCPLKIEGAEAAPVRALLIE